MARRGDGIYQRGQFDELVWGASMDSCTWLRVSSASPPPVQAKASGEFGVGDEAHPDDHHARRRPRGLHPRTNGEPASG
jgi:hypothetical protein